MRVKSLFLFSLIVVVAAGCKKDAVATGNLQGSWYIKKITGINGFTSTAGLDFTNGVFTFNNDGSLDYKEGMGATYKGTWNLTDINQVGNCSTAADGTQSCNYFWETTLQLDVVKVGGLQKKTAYFEFFEFIDTTNFKVQLVPSHEYIFSKK